MSSQPLSPSNFKDLFDSVEAFLFDCDGWWLCNILLTYFQFHVLIHSISHSWIRCHLEGRWTHPRRSENSPNASLQGKEARLRHQQFLEVALSVRSKVPILRNFCFAGSLVFSFFRLQFRLRCSLNSFCNLVLFAFRRTRYSPRRLQLLCTWRPRISLHKTRFPSHSFFYFNIFPRDY